jgi:hypothetical protein
VQDEVLSGWTRIWIGATGGLIAIVCKGLFQELPFVMRLIDTDQQGKVVSEMYGFGVLAIGFLALGGFASWYFDEKSRRACFAVGLVGPALLGTLSGGNFSDASRPPPTRGGWNIEYLLPVSPASAAELLTKSPSEDRGSLWEGLKLVVGVGKDQSRYYVVAGPYKNENDASSLGAKIMKSHPNIPVFLGTPNRKDGSVKLIVGNGLAYSEARSLRDNVKNFPELKDAQDISLTAHPPSDAFANAIN